MEIPQSADIQVMSLFQWSETYSVGYPDIDSQHKRLFQLAEQLHAAMTAGKGKQCVSTTLANLIAYTKRHFADEEILMQSHRYPFYQQHKAEHQALTEKVVQFQQSFEAGRATVTMELLNFLSNWLTHHIGAVDKKVGAYLTERRH
jgi:hemerythrin-like metal-binding protein